MTRRRIRRLEFYLRRTGLREISKPGEPLRVRELKPLAGQGLSGLTFLLTLVEPQARLILKVHGNGDKALKEVRLLDFLKREGVPAPRVYGFDLKGDVLGRPFLIMQEIRSKEEVEPKLVTEELAATLYLLHSLDPDAVSGMKLDGKSLQDELKEIKLLSFALLILSFPPPIPMIRRVLGRVRELEGVSRDNGVRSLLHGDCGLDNTLYSQGRVYLIDLEGAFVGNPAYDVGYAYHSLCLSNRFGLELADHFVSAYEDLSGRLKDLSLYKRIVALKMILLLRLLGNPGLPVGLLLGGEKVKMILRGRRFLRQAEEYYRSFVEASPISLD